MLTANDLVAGYGGATVVDRASLDVQAGEIVGMVGRNGVGKTTLVHSLMGLIRPRAGTVTLHGNEITATPPHERCRQGLAIVPQGRRLFASLTVEETLRLAHTSTDGWSAADAYERFPRLGDRRKTRACHLSGGEQSLLAVARAMATGPTVLLLDEPSEGLSPGALRELAVVLESIRGQGLAVLLVEQNLGFVLGLADRLAVMARGRVVATHAAHAAKADPDLITRHLGV